jgi:hypothetical protein
MVASFGAVLIVGVALAATLALRAGRRTLAGGPVGEIAEILGVIDSHDAERALAAFGEGRSAAPMLPRPSCVAFKAATLMPILGAHAGRLSAAFHASTEAPQPRVNGSPSGLAERPGDPDRACLGEAAPHRRPRRKAATRAARHHFAPPRRSHRWA